MKYQQVKSGEIVQPRMKGYKLCCCDCGLVHVFTFIVVKHGRGYKVRFTAERDARATAAIRREKRKRESR